MKKTALLAIVFFLYIQPALSQELPTIIPPSPTVANLMHFEEVPVSHYTGQPDISLPLFSKTLGQDLALTLGLSYNTQGIKINNRSGWTGTGWSLQAGGTISRTVRGVPDEKRKGYLPDISSTGILHNDDFWNYENFNTYQKEEFLWYASGGSKLDHFDYQLDLFQFSVLGLSGRFVIVKEQGVLVPKLLSRDINFRIEIDYDPTSFELNAFTITDVKGNRFIFDVYEELMVEPFTAIELQNRDQYYSGIGQQGLIRNAWHLTRIETSNAKMLAELEYKDSRVNYQVSASRTTNTKENPSSNWEAIKMDPYNASVLPPKKSYTFLTTYGNTKKISKISFRDYTSVEFTFGELHPETKGSALGGILIKENNQVNKRYTFNYETTDRLWLMSIDEIAGTKKNRYNLEYTDKEDLPSYDSLADNWGYNDGNSVVISTANCTRRTPFDKEAIKKGLLERIIYPTGGIKEFVFENQTISYQSMISLQAGDQPKAVALSDQFYKKLNPDNWVPGGGVSFNFNTATNQTTGIVTVESAQEVIFKRGTFASTLVNCGTTESELLFNSLIRITSRYPNNQYTMNIRLDQSEVRFNIPKGVYNVELIFLDNCAELDINICFNIKTFKSWISRFVYGGGVRIKDIVFKDSSLPRTEPSRKISYSYREPNDKTKSSGAIDGDITGMRKKYQKREQEYLFLVTDVRPDFYGCYYEPCLPGGGFFTVETDQINSELTQGQYVGYKTVRVSETRNGYTVYTHTSPQDYASPTNVFRYPYYPAPNIDFKRGLILKKQVFRNPTSPPIPGQEPEGKLNEIVNTYEFKEEDLANNYKLHEYSCGMKRFFNYSYEAFLNKTPAEQDRLKRSQVGYGPATDCIETFKSYSNCNLKVPYFFFSDNIKSGWAKLKTTSVKKYFYDSDGNQSSTQTRDEFTYNPLNFQVKQKLSFFNEGGIEKNTRTKYHYPVGSILGSNTPTIINKLKSLNKINELIAKETFRNGVKLSQINTTYDEQQPNVDLVLPIEIHTVKGVETTSNPFETRILYHDYDAYGNPLEVSKADGTHIVYIWGYNQTQPIAKIENATYAQVSSRVANLQTLSNADDDRTVDILNSNGTITKVGKEGDLREALRNLRINFKNSLVTTYTYDPLIGVTSVTDPRGNTVYYDYDPFNRLKHVKDKDGNILSENEYNYKN